MSTLTISIIKEGGPEYKSMLDLRERVLRQISGDGAAELDLKNDTRFTHLAAIVEGKVIGTLSLEELSKKAVMIHNLAVEPDMQHKGIGTRLVSFAEEYAIKKGYCRIELVAREQVTGFFHDLAYSTEGKPFDDHELRQVKMIKDWCA